jgi:hypothetical protein
VAAHGDDQHGDAPVTTGMIDLLAVLSASRALSSETSVERLHARVVEVLSAMTGATGVHLLLCGDQGDWPVPVSACRRPQSWTQPGSPRFRCRWRATPSGCANHWS